VVREKTHDAGSGATQQLEGLPDSGLFRSAHLQYQQDCIRPGSNGHSVRDGDTGWGVDDQYFASLLQLFQQPVERT
jgi:hypothetical protein